MNFIDLLILTLAQHEKDLSLLIKRLEEISEKFEKICTQMENAKDFVKTVNINKLFPTFSWLHENFYF